MVMSLVPMSALADRSNTDVAYAVEGGNIYFDKATGTITDCDYRVTEAIIPAEIAGVKVTSIGGDAFRNCTKLTSIEIPNSVTSIGERVFNSCENLASINVAEGNSKYSSEDGVLFNKDKTEFMRYPEGKADKEYTIPDSVTRIGDGAFYGCTSLASIVIPNSVTSIGVSAFYGCTSLTSINIPNSVTSIGEGAFGNCTKLTSIEIPNSVTSIGNSAFNGCTSLASVDIPNSVTSIDRYAFQGCTSLASIDIPNSVTSIGEVAFYGCTSLTSIDIPNSVTSIDRYAFYGCTSLASIDIPNSVTSIDYSSFSGCTSLASIDIPNSVTSIGGSAFQGCTSLVSIDIPNSVTSIGYSSFSGCTSLASIDLPNSVTSIDNYAFQGCTSLTSVTIPNSVRGIGSSAFQGCTSLKNVTFSANLSSIGDFSFEGCKSLETINIPNKVSSIGNSAFSGCTALTTVYLPTSVKTIGNGAFRYCTSLADVYYDGDAAQWNAIKIEPYNEPLTGAEINYGVEHTHSYTAAVTVPTCTEQGYTTYTCSCGDNYKSDYKDALGHDYQNGTCTRCGAKDPGVTPPHTHDYKATVTAPTCTQAGYTTYTCSCGDSYKSDYKDALGHDYKNGTCTRCGAKDPGATPPHTHDYKSVVTKPTCTEQGYTTYTCSICGDSYKGDYKDARGHLFVLGKCLRCGEQDPDSHTHEYTETVVAPTCTTRGYTEHVCSCGSSYKTDYTAALGHDYKNGLCARCGAKDPSAHTHDYKAVVTAPTCTERGYTTYTCSVCGDSYKGSYVDPLGHDYKNGTCTRCGAKDPNYKPQADFTDVASGSYCYDAVQWAVANGITKGTDKTHFSPNAGCTRGQVVTFLWRAAGEPTVNGNVGFVDVAPGSYCYEAVKWAVANGITKGTDATHFSPNETCTRGQVVTFMYRAEGEPAVGGSNGFVDVAAGSYCYNAVQWAVANGITKGTDATHFSPNATCTRGQVVTFLYRAQ